MLIAIVVVKIFYHHNIFNVDNPFLIARLAASSSVCYPST